MSFGLTGALLFAVLNILQLVGWTAIMIYDGLLAAAGIFHVATGMASCDRRTHHHLDFELELKV